MGWQPIETAPRGGVWILVFGPDGVDKARFCEWTFEAFWERKYTAEYDNELSIVSDPSHWMPLPPPPKGDA
jgi:hypothetical protein